MWARPPGAPLQVASWLYDKSVVDSIFEEVPTRYADRRNDFTKMFPTLSRRGDNAQMVRMLARSFGCVAFSLVRVCSPARALRVVPHSLDAWCADRVRPACACPAGCAGAAVSAPPAMRAARAPPPGRTPC
jgi:hypothetical protein